MDSMLHYIEVLKSVDGQTDRPTDRLMDRQMDDKQTLMVTIPFVGLNWEMVIICKIVSDAKPLGYI